jgi:hypothetical protein
MGLRRPESARNFLHANRSSGRPLKLSSGGSIGDEVARLSLDYPNGRSHVIDHHGPQRFHVGQEFELYGRRWRIAAITRPRPKRGVESPRVISCVPLTESALVRDSSRA